MLKARDHYKEAASVYFRISGEVMPNLDILVDDNPFVTVAFCFLWIMCNCEKIHSKH